VYAALARPQGRTCHAVVNIGLRPTLQSPIPRLQVEAHLLDFDGELYGTELEIVFVQKLRDEQQFATREELGQQIARDIQLARTLF
jgi:riboflavin kinase/FMN adenylyltransferase